VKMLWLLIKQKAGYCSECNQLGGMNRYKSKKKLAKY